MADIIEISQKEINDFKILTADKLLNQFFINELHTKMSEEDYKVLVGKKHNFGNRDTDILTKLINGEKVTFTVFRTVEEIVELRLTPYLDMGTQSGSFVSYRLEYDIYEK